MKPIRQSLITASILAALLAPAAPAFAQHAVHIVVAQAPDAAKVTETGNAGEIAKFLSGANPNLPFDTLNGLLLAHGGHHIREIQQLQSKQYAEEAQTWDAMKKHMYVIADALAGAIAKQFPAKFS